MGKWVAVNNIAPGIETEDIAVADDFDTLIDMVKENTGDLLKEEMQLDPMHSIDIYYDPEYEQKLVPV